MERHDSEEADFETACNKLADLSVCEPERSPLKGIPHDSPQLEATTSPPSLSTRPDCQPLRRTLKSSESELEHDRDAQVRFNKLVKKAKLLSQEGKVQEALELNKKALQIHHHEKLARRIAKMEEYLKNYGGEDEEDETEGGMVQLGSDTGFFLHKDLTAKLYNHQKEGVLWLWRLHRKNKGGILGDDMGLGKTIQIIAFLSGLFDMDKVQTVMIVLPVSVMVNWEKEFNKWAPGIPVHSFHGTSKRERERTLNRVQRRGGVMLTTYGMVLTSWEQLSNYNGRDFVWDYVILDEGHKIKNPSKTTKAIHGVAARHRIILSGTPIQNNLKELWTLFDWVHQGALLGTLRTFKMEFENPIIRARERDATGGEKRLGMEMAQTLKTIIDPYFLRRTKAQVKEEEKDAGAKGRPHPKSIKMPTMMFKNDFVVWLYLSDTQLKIYRDFLELDSVKELLMSKKSPLVALTVLKKICDHPRLLSLRACHQLGMHGQGMVEDELELPSSLESAATKIELLDDSVLVGEAGKMSVLLSLLDQLRQDGHRALIFSQSRKILDIIQKVLRNQGHKVMRLDGTVKGLSERDELVQKFQRNTSYSVFLLTTQVGGVGLTLTAADRVIIYDPSWNPATDAQAVDRIFRIGQTKNVVVYRLITCGTVEEKIYRRQIFKDSITRQTMGNAKDPYRYFTKHELRELFLLEEPRFSNTQRQLEEMHGLHRRRDSELDDHIAFLHSLDIFGISDHDLMFSQENPDDEMEEEVELTPAENMPAVTAQHQDYILHRVQKAKEIIERESSVPGTMEQRMKTGFPAVSVYSASEGRALMSSVPVFQPGPADSQRLMLNRPGGGVTLFQPRPSDTSRQMLSRPAAVPAKPPQEIIVYPPKPVKPDVKADVKPDVKSDTSSNTSVGSSTSEPIDLTLDDDDVRVAARKNPSSSSWASSSDGDSGPAEDVMLPKIEKRRTEDRRARREVQKEGADRMADSHTKHTASPSSQVPTQRPPSPKAAPQSPTSVPQSPKAAPQSPTSVPQSPRAAPQLPTSVPQSPRASELQDCKPLPPPCTTPRGKVEGLVEEELIISPNSYTPLLATRQKRRRMVDSPVVALEKALAASVLVEESPETTRASATPSSGDAPLSVAERKGDDDSQASNEIASFLAEDDLVEIQESFIEEEAETGSPINREAGDKGDGSASDAAEPSRASKDASPIRMMKNKRRSVCRRVAVIESSEDEEEDEENKENIHPSFCSSSYRSRQTEEEEEEGEERADGEREAEEDEEYDDDEVDGTDETDELDGADEVGEEEAGLAEAREEADGSVVVYDESMSEDREDEDGGAESEEEQEEEAEEEEIDKELVAELLKDGKHFYKQQRYPEALAKCEAALTLLPDPQLQAMVDKIRRKIETGL